MSLIEALTREARQRGVPVSFVEEFLFEYETWAIGVVAPNGETFMRYAAPAAQVFQLYKNLLRQFGKGH